MSNLRRFHAPLLLILLGISPGAALARPHVVSVSPKAQAMAGSKGLQVTVDFDEPIDPATIHSRSFSVFGRWSGVCPGTISFENNGQRLRFMPSREISAGEWVTVTLSRDIRNESGQPLQKGYAWNFWTAAAPGTLDLQRVATIDVRRPKEGPIRTYGAYAGDLNGDGFHDFTVPNEDASDVRVFLNDGHGGYTGFTVFPLPPGSKPSTNEGADFDGDGLLDFACGNIIGGTMSVFRGDGQGRFFPPRSYTADDGVRGLTALDLNGDGATDVVTANRSGRNISIFLNNSDGSFRPGVNQDTGSDKETAAASADFNEDGVFDVVVGTYSNGFKGRPFGEIVLLLGDGTGGLSVSARRDAGGNSWMVAVGDMDNDGHVDVVSANSHQNNFTLLRGDGAGGLGAAETYSTGLFPLAIDVGDLDGDGDLEVVTSNFNSADWRIHENDGSGRFINQRTLPSTAAGSCAVLHDRDRDGDLDMTGIDELDDDLALFDNPGTPTSVETKAIVDNFRLSQSYPNPFESGGTNGDITIPFTLRQSGTVTIELYNIRGQKEATIVSVPFPVGTNRVLLAPQRLNLPAGIYFYTVHFRKVTQTRKLVLLP